MFTCEVSIYCLLVYHVRKHHAFSQCCTNIEQTQQTMGQRYTSIGLEPHVTAVRRRTGRVRCINIALNVTRIQLAPPLLNSAKPKGSRPYVITCKVRRYCLWLCTTVLIPDFVAFTINYCYLIIGLS